MACKENVMLNRANCLVEPKTGRVLAIDSRLAQWLGLEAEYSGTLYLAEMMPDLVGEWTTQLTKIVCNPHLEFQAKVSFVSLVGPQGNHVLVSIRPLEGRPEETIFCDALTGLPDRRELARQRARWRDQTPDKKFPHAVLFLDLDKFKQINDRHGHAMGDRVLAALAKRWQGCVRAGDLLTRYGGDEFVVLLAGIKRNQELEPILERLAAATAEPIEIGQLKLSVTATIGVALAVDTSVDLEQLLAEADRDMYAKKGAVDRSQ